MKNSAKQLITDIIIAAILFVCVFFVPVISFVFSIASNVFFMMLSYRHGTKGAFVFLFAFLAGAVAVSCLDGFSADNICLGISAFCASALAGGTMGIMAKKKCSFRAVITGGTLAYLCDFIVTLLALKFIHKLDFATVVIKEPLNEFFEMYKQILISSNAENASAVIEAMADIQWYLQQAIVTIMPSLFIIFCGISAYVLFLAGRKIIYRKNGQIMEYPHFHQLQLPRYMSTVMALLYVATFFMKASAFMGAISNILLILTTVYTFCGISVVDFYFRKSRIHWSLRIIIYALASLVLSVLGIILPFANVFTILLLLGVIDSFVDFRRLRLEVNTNEK